MARLNRFQIMKLIQPKIIKYLKELNKDVISTKEIFQLIYYCKENLMLPNITTNKQFIKFLIDNDIVKEYKLIKDTKEIKKYALKEVSVFKVALSINKKAYLSHYSAMFINNLTDNIPKVVYINIEQSVKPRNGESKLNQEAINKAFFSNPRMTNNIYTLEEYDIKIFSLNGKNTSRYGVVEGQYNSELIPVTCIERTLIDIVVRPQYSGSVFETLDAYKRAKGNFSVNRLCAMLKRLDYIYPYHQIIGFYMEKAGYDEKSLNLLKKLGIQYDMYLTYQMHDREYSTNWRVFFPKGM